MKSNIPSLIEQIRENMLDPNTSSHIRYNYSQTILNIKEYAEMALKEYDKQHAGRDNVIRKRGW